MSDNQKYRDASYKDWLKRRSNLKNEIMNYKRHQWEVLKKVVFVLVWVVIFLVLFFGVETWIK